MAFAAPAFAASVTAATLQKAKQAADAKGYAFITSHDEILASAKREGKLRAQSSLDPNTFKPLMASFKKKYPFADIEIQEMTGTDTAQRFLLDSRRERSRNGIRYISRKIFITTMRRMRRNSMS